MKTRIFQIVFLLTMSIFLICQMQAQPTSQEVTNQIDALDIEEITKQFKDFDLNNDGYNDAGELRQSIPGITEDQIALIFNEYDTDMDGVLSLEEYLNLYNKKLQEKNANGQNEEQL